MPGLFQFVAQLAILLLLHYSGVRDFSVTIELIAKPLKHIAHMITIIWWEHAWAETVNKEEGK